MFTRNNIFILLRDFLSDYLGESYSLTTAINSLNLLITLTNGIEPNAEISQKDEASLLLSIKQNLSEALEKNIQMFPLKIHKMVVNFNENFDDLHSRKYLLSAYLKMVDTISDYLFNDTISELILTSFFTRYLYDSISNNNIFYFGSSKLPYSSVYFLSYSFADKFYTLGLFVLFLKEKKILLYIDWLFKGQNNNTTNLKKYIQTQMKYCKGLIFLRSKSSELRLGGPQIRQWCSWEMGAFFGTNIELHHSYKDGYFINMFGLKTSSNSIINNLGEISDKSFRTIKL